MLPERVRVKLMSEAAEYISTEPVIQRDFPLAEFLEAVVAVGGKNPDRVIQILRAGSTVIGNYRYRWTPLAAETEELAPLLARFPDPRPERAFEPQRCVFAAIRAAGETIELPRERAARRRLLKKISFWDVLMDVAAGRIPRYQTYSYWDRADLYVFEPTHEDQRRLREAAALLAIGRTRQRICALPLEKITLFVNR